MSKAPNSDDSDDPVVTSKPKVASSGKKKESGVVDRPYCKACGMYLTAGECPNQGCPNYHTD